MRPAAELSPHRNCWANDPCEVGRPHECPPHIAHAKRDKGLPWSELDMRRDPGGWRHYLEDQKIHCGDRLELQSITQKSDDYGEFTVYLPQAVSVRYEATFHPDKVQPTLYASLGGHEVMLRFEPWMRFRWPARRS